MDVTVSGATGSSVRVTWTAAPSGSVELLGHQVTIERLTGRGCGSQHRQTYSVNLSTATDYIVMGLSGLSTYRIEIVAVNIFGSSVSISNAPIDTLPSRELHATYHARRTIA